MFNIRVYGLLINERHEVLVSDELIRGGHYTKFCGGGMEVGEGTRDCLKREFLEEMNLRVDVGEHIYTTDFFQPSAFKPGEQLIAIYYFVHPLEQITARINSTPFSFSPEELQSAGDNGEAECFRFVPWDEFSADTVTLPVDKLVAGIIRGKINIS